MGPAFGLMLVAIGRPVGTFGLWALRLALLAGERMIVFGAKQMPD